MPTALDPDLGVEVATDAVARALKAGADAARVHHVYREVFEVNFDTNDITLVRTTVGDTVTITVYDGTKKGSTELTGRAHDAVDVAVAQALEAARAGEPDPANVLPDEPAEPAPSTGDADPDREAMIDVVLRHIETSKREYPTLKTDNSTYSFVQTWVSYANSHDRVQHARTGRYAASSIVSGKDDTKATSFNYVSHISKAPIDDLTSLPTVRRLFDSTAASFDARPIPKTFVGDVIVTPEAASTLIGSVVGALSGLALMRKTTPYLERLGDTIAAPAFSLRHRPSQVAAAPPFDNDGFVNHDLDIIDAGVLANFIVDWYFSRKLDRPMTTGNTNFVVDGGDTALDDIIASTERGILLGRYSGGTPNQNLDFSGVAKNSWYVEDGKVLYPVTETMVAGNFGSVLESIRAVSRERLDFGSAIFPWIATTGVTVSTK